MHWICVSVRPLCAHRELRVHRRHVLSVAQAFPPADGRQLRHSRPSPLRRRLCVQWEPTSCWAARSSIPQAPRGDTFETVPTATSHFLARTTKCVLLSWARPLTVIVIAAQSSCCASLLLSDGHHNQNCRVPAAYLVSSLSSRYNIFMIEMFTQAGCLIVQCAY